jgi:hypothetical protein
VNAIPLECRTWRCGRGLTVLRRCCHRRHRRGECRGLFRTHDAHIERRALCELPFVDRKREGNVGISALALHKVVRLPLD